MNMQALHKVRLVSFWLVSFTISFFQYGCKKLVDVNPPDNRITAGNVYNSDITATAVLTGMYSKLSQTAFSGQASIPTLSLWAGLSADEFAIWNGVSPSMIAYYKNDLSVNAGGGEFWASAYSYIYTCNAAIEGLSASNKLSQNVKDQLLGEAKFVRAFFYFYLVNLYGDVPLTLTTDYTVTADLIRAPKEIVYQQIIDDLIESQKLLVDGFVKADATTLYDAGLEERVRPNRATAAALLSRVYLFIGDYLNAEAYASEVIDNTALFELLPLNEVFLKNSREAIWQLQPVDPFVANTGEAYMFVLTVPPAGLNYFHPVFLNSSLIDFFEAGDSRLLDGNWVKEYADVSGTYRYPYKYKDVNAGEGATPTEYSTLLRLGEQYLIRAEARAQQGKVAEAQADLNAIRSRAGLPNTTANDKASLLAAILDERRVELFAELGHRWLDLKRTGKVDNVMTIETALKGGAWKTHQQVYPIPLNDLLTDPNLVQNPGYN